MNSLYRQTPTNNSNGIATRPAFKRRSPPRRLRGSPSFSPACSEINPAYVDSQILRRPQTIKQATPSELEPYEAYAHSFSPEFEIDAYASNEDLIRRFIPTNA